MAQSLRDPMPLSGALLALAEASLNAGDSEFALTTASEAEKRFAAAKQFDSQWRALLIKSRAADKIGEKQSSQQLASQAQAVRGDLEQEWGKANYQSYLSRPDVLALSQFFTTADY
jgi:hypothetical protein